MKLLRIIALVVSIVFYPMFMPAYAMLMLCYCCTTNALFLQPTAHVSTLFSVLLICGTLLLTCIIPFSIILFMIRQGTLRDAYIEDREARQTPYIYSVISTAIWCYYLWRIVHLPAFIVLMAVGATLALVAVSIINRWWKISAHLSCMGALIGSVAGWSWQTGIFSIWLLPLLFFLALILMYARLYLKAHTPMQVITGLLLGFSFTFLAALFNQTCACQYS